MGKTSLMAMLYSALAIGGTGPGLAPRRPTGGHRAHKYIKTPADLERIQLAAEKRARKAAKRHASYLACQDGYNAAHR